MLYILTSEINEDPVARLLCIFTSEINEDSVARQPLEEELKNFLGSFFRSNIYLGSKISSNLTSSKLHDSTNLLTFLKGKKVKVCW